uniref:Uncharacterized protein n=1 Tax=Marmota marmota marmota TaxID=9994 RepID=A0A8C5ZRI6_MARMA
MAAIAFKWMIPKRILWKHLFPVQNSAFSGVCHKSTFSSLPDAYNLSLKLNPNSDLLFPCPVIFFHMPNYFR